MNELEDFGPYEFNADWSCDAWFIFSPISMINSIQDDNEIQKKVDDVVATFQIEGIELPPKTIETVREFIAGEINAKEEVAQILDTSRFR